MKEGKASQTADLAAVVRAAESMKPEDERICYDPLAKEFPSGIFSAIIRNRLLTKIAFWRGERMAPGAFSEGVVRTRCIDDCLKACIDDGIEQLAILGAGYDSRAYRFEELKGKVKVFEVDHPITQKAKIDKVKKILGYLPDHVVYVPIDFEKESLEERLFESGYNSKLKTLFIWEAVTMFITAEAVDATLAFVAKNSGEGSSIIFNYALQSVVDGTCDLEGSEKWRKILEGRGEPWTFGIEEGTTEEFLTRRGFDQVKDASEESLRSVYAKGVTRSKKVPKFARIVHATVKPREGT